jgi:hypothetical protein
MLVGPAHHVIVASERPHSSHGLALLGAATRGKALTSHPDHRRPPGLRVHITRSLSRQTGRLLSQKGPERGKDISILPGLRQAV